MRRKKGGSRSEMLHTTLNLCQYPLSDGGEEAKETEKTYKLLPIPRLIQPIPNPRDKLLLTPPQLRRALVDLFRPRRNGSPGVRDDREVGGFDCGFAVC
jgi:hypothetical protein